MRKFENLEEIKDDLKEKYLNIKNKIEIDAIIDAIYDYYSDNPIDYKLDYKLDYQLDYQLDYIKDYLEYTCFIKFLKYECIEDEMYISNIRKNYVRSLSYLIYETI